MSHAHLKRVVAPKTWILLRKARKFVTKPSAGPHSLKFSIPIALFLKDMGFASTTKEAKKILNTKEILVDGRRVKDFKFPIGLMDVVNIKDVNGFFRIVLDHKGRLKVLSIKDSEANVKLCRINNKKVIRSGKVQLNLNDGSNILSNDKELKIGDTLVLELPAREVKDVLRFGKDFFVLLVGGSHMGSFGVIEDIKDDVVMIKSDGIKFNSEKRFTFVVGAGKEVVQLR